MSEVEKALRVQRSQWELISKKASELRKTLKLNTKPRRILFFGIGSSHYAARFCDELMRRQFKSEGISVWSGTSLEALDRVIDISPNETNKDWWFGFSHRGKTPETVEVLKKAKENGAHVFLVSSEDTSSQDISVSSLYQIKTSDLETCEPHTKSVTGAICAVTSFLLGDPISKAWKALAKESDPDLKAWTKTLKNEPPTIILGFHHDQWLAREVALKLMEMARLPVRAFELTEFSHGPRLSVTGSRSVSERAWWIGFEDKFRSLELPKELKALRRFEFPKADRLSLVRALVELHWMALAVAIGQNQDPDGK